MKYRVNGETNRPIPPLKTTPNGKIESSSSTNLKGPDENKPLQMKGYKMKSKSNLSAVQITDKNGKRTTVHRNLNGPVAPAKMAAALGVKPASAKREYDDNGFDGKGIHILTGTDEDSDGNDRHNAAVLRVERPSIFHSANPYTPAYGQQSAWSGADQFGYERDGFTHISRGSAPHFLDKDRAGYDRRGFHINTLHRETGTPFDPDGYDRNGVTIDGRGFDGSQHTRNPSVWERDDPNIISDHEVVEVVEVVEGSHLLTEDDIRCLTREADRYFSVESEAKIDEAFNDLIRGGAELLIEISYGRQAGGKR